MNDKPFRVVPLEATHSRVQFKSGSEPLDRYFREQVTQDIKRRVASCFVALSNDGRSAGYYTLASAGIYIGDLPEELTRKLPRYPSVPAVRLGRLAVDETFQGSGLGGALLVDALMRVIRSDIAGYAMVVDAKDQKAVDFYRHYGFIETTSKPQALFLPLKTITGLSHLSKIN